MGLYFPCHSCNFNRSYLSPCIQHLFSLSVCLCISFSKINTFRTNLLCCQIWSHQSSSTDYFMLQSYLTFAPLKGEDNLVPKSLSHRPWNDSEQRSILSKYYYTMFVHLRNLPLRVQTHGRQLLTVRLPKLILEAFYFRHVTSLENVNFLHMFPLKFSQSA